MVYFRPLVQHLSLAYRAERGLRLLNPKLAKLDAAYLTAAKSAAEK